MPALDVKVVPADTDRFGDGPRLQHEPVRRARRRRSSAPPAKIRDKAQLLAGMALERRAGDAHVVQRRVGDGDGSDPAQVKTIEDIALYAHGTGALPPGVEGGLDAQTVYRD